MSTNEKSLDVSEINEDDCSSTATNSNKSNYKYRQKIRKRSLDICYTLNFYEKFGNIYINQNANKIFVAKIRKVDFDDNFQELFEKGKNNLGNYFKEESINIPDITFWYQRYYYYSRFDEGIKMDQESWWSVTPEELAKYTAGLCRGKIVADGFCGSGGNVIQFSKYCKKVYAIDIDEKKIEISRNNAKVYQCEDNIEFIKSDYLKMINKLKVDYVFLSPPWGGIKYKDSDVYSIKELMTPNIYDIVKTSLNISKNIIFYLPRTLILDELFEIISSLLNQQNPGSGDRIYFDVHVLKSAKKIKALLIIFGHDIKEISKSDLSEYINFQYPSISTRHLQILTTIAKILGNYKFLQAEFYLRRQYLELKNNNNNNILTNTVDPYTLIKYLYEIMTEYEKIRLKSFNILKNSGAINKSNKNSLKKYYSLTHAMNRPLSANNIHTNTTHFSNPTISMNNINNISLISLHNNNPAFYLIKEIQIEYLSQNNKGINKLPIKYNQNISSVNNKFNNIISKSKKFNEISNSIK